MRKFLWYSKCLLFILFVTVLTLSISYPGEATETNARGNDFALETNTLLVERNTDISLVGLSDSQ